MDAKLLLNFYKSLTRNQKIDFFINMVELDNDFDTAARITVQMSFDHEEVMAWLTPNEKLVEGSDFVERKNNDDEVIVTNLLHVYSDKEEAVTQHIKMLLEAGEVLTTVYYRTNGKSLKYERCLISHNWENPVERPIIPICYN